MADNGQRHFPRNRQHKDRPITVDGRHQTPLTPRHSITKFCSHPEHKSYTSGSVIGLMREHKVS